MRLQKMFKVHVPISTNPMNQPSQLINHTMLHTNLGINTNWTQVQYEPSYEIKQFKNQQPQTNQIKK